MTKGWDRAVRGTAIGLALAGAQGLRILGLYISAIPTAGAGADQVEPVAVGLVSAFFILTAASNLAGGVWIWLKRRHAMWLGMASLVPHLLAFEFSGFQFRYLPLGFIGIEVREIQGVFLLVVDLNWKFHVGFNSIADWKVRINVIAVAALTVLVKASREQKVRQSPARGPEANEYRYRSGTFPAGM
jgi:drug/metabolite transporter superfamily protein YnfA